ncbi:tartrate dehydrogenase, partial [Burkholderia sp. Bp8998]
QGKYRAAHDAILRAIEEGIAQGPRTPDLGGTANTTQVGVDVSERVCQ